MENTKQIDMKKTALQEAFNLLEELHPSFFDVHTEKGRTFINTFHKFIAIEKQQIIEAFFEGKNDGILMERYSDYEHISPGEYYNENFKS